MPVIHTRAVVNPVQTLVLPRVGVLEFIHHGHRVLLADRVCQFTTIRMQCMVQALQQIVEVELRLVQLGLLVSLTQFMPSVCDQQTDTLRFLCRCLHQHREALKECKVVCRFPTACLQFFCGEAGQNFQVDGLPE